MACRRETPPTPNAVAAPEELGRCRHPTAPGRRTRPGAGIEEGPRVRNRTRRRLLALALATLTVVVSPASAAEPAVYTLAILPSAPPLTMNQAWTPFVERLSRSTGLQFRLKHYERMAEFERDLWSGGPDFVFSSPIQLVVGHLSNGYVPLVRARRPIGVGLFVRRDSAVHVLEDLRGRKISFVGNKNLCSVMIQHLLATQNEKLEFDKEYAGSTRNVILSVLLGKTIAGAIFLPDLDREPEEIRAQLRKIVETPPIAAHPLSVHPRVARGVQEAVTKAVAAMGAAPDLAELLATVKLTDPVRAEYPRDYAPLESVDIKGLTNWGQ